MHNIHLVGVHHMDHFSLRGCFLVIGAFGVVTIISYINELAKAGLLGGSPKIKLMHGFETFKRSIDGLKVAGHYQEDDTRVILRKNGDLHHLNIDLLPLQVEDNDSLNDDLSNARNGNADGEEIQIALRLKKKNRYIEADNSSIKIYQFRQVLPNFYLDIDESLQRVVTRTGNFSGRKWMADIFSREVLGPKLACYRNCSKVFIYQHDPHGYATRDCFLSLAVEKNLSVSAMPLNTIHRKNWEKMDRRRREGYEVLYGGLSFGVCEGHSKACSYFVMMMHPLDRLLQTYWLCTNATRASFCQFLHLENITSIYDFVRSYGSAFFHKLLYYSRHCRLIGDHEMCIHDDNIFFVLSPQEKSKYLDSVLQNLEHWFSVVGIAEELETSLSLFSGVTGLDFTRCLASGHTIPKQFYKFFPTFHGFLSTGDIPLATLTIDGLKYSTIHDLLLKDPQVASWLSVDMKIYKRLVEIFRKQVSVYHRMRSLMMLYYNPSLSDHLMSVPRNETNRDKVLDVSQISNTTQQSDDNQSHNSSDLNSGGMTATSELVFMTCQTATTQTMAGVINNTTECPKNHSISQRSRKTRQNRKNIRNT